MFTGDGAYAQALEERDVGKVRSLMHPATMGCINDQNRDAFDKIFAQETRFFGTWCPPHSCGSELA
jgi:hypothetical protein